MSESYENVIKSCKSDQMVWTKIKDNLDLLSLKRTKKGNYGIFYNGIFLGIFIGKDYINEEELKEDNISINGIMEH